MDESMETCPVTFHHKNTTFSFIYNSGLFNRVAQQTYLYIKYFTFTLIFWDTGFLAYMNCKL